MTELHVAGLFQSSPVNVFTQFGRRGGSPGIIPYSENRFLLCPSSRRAQLGLDFLRDASLVEGQI